MFRRRSKKLLPFEAVKTALNLYASVDRGRQDIDLDKVLGSVGRSRDFTRSFLPKNHVSEQRWRRLDDLFHRQGFEPIRVYQVGQIYFVLDGNHRVSVSRSLGLETIEAYVVEFPTSVPVCQDDDMESILRKSRQPPSDCVHKSAGLHRQMHSATVCCARLVIG